MNEPRAWAPRDSFIGSASRAPSRRGESRLGARERSRRRGAAQRVDQLGREVLLDRDQLLDEREAGLDDLAGLRQSVGERELELRSGDRLADEAPPGAQSAQRELLALLDRREE